MEKKTVLNERMTFIFIRKMRCLVLRTFQFALIIIFVSIASCDASKPEGQKRFKYVKPKASGIDFINQLTPTNEMNIFSYMYFYNGGGVAIGDINNDGLPDIYFTSNMEANKLYLNQGNLKFKDITKTAKVGGSKTWSTGVSMVDVNADGLLDLYICNSGLTDSLGRMNELFVNNGDLTFTESAEAFGLADAGNSTHASFFDYDLDGDLDCYLINNAYEAGSSTKIGDIRNLRGNRGGDKLYENQEGKFIDVTIQSGIYSSDNAYGLGVAVNDIDRDGWPDIYISNDFLERDYLYINNQDGTFDERLIDYMPHTSEFSMGSDMSDLNNDGLPDILVVDMLPSGDHRLKTSVMFTDYQTYAKRVKNGYHHQYMRNTLHLNNGNGTFSDVALFANVAATDWSWSPLVADFDNDGIKDVFIANGLYKDITDQDFTNFIAADERRIQKVAKRTEGFLELAEKIPSVKLRNFIYKGADKTNLKLVDFSEEWGLGISSFSNGSAYGDLDLDGDLDLVINNVNQEAFLFENRTSQLDNHKYLQLSFDGDTLNPFGIGAEIRLRLNDGASIFYQHYPNKGFQSSMDHIATIGVGNSDNVPVLTVKWPDGKSETIADISTNDLLVLDYKKAKEDTTTPEKIAPLLREARDLIDYKHVENSFVDFDYDRLLMHMNARQGPALSVADLNGDNLDDFYVGGAVGQAGSLFIQTKAGKFEKSIQTAFEADKNYEDVSSVFFDADSDGDLDLYVVTGGSERGRQISYQDRLYLNNGEGALSFQRAKSLLPKEEYAGSCVAVSDYDNDGDPDLFVGTRLDPSQYGVPATSMLLENEGGVFMDVTMDKLPQAQSLGMITDAAWTDYDNDGKQDLIVVGEWMPVTIFKNRGSGFQLMSKVEGLEHSSGLWNTIAAMDLNGDGQEDLICGNLGLNSRFQASEAQPFHLFINDFDNNGTLDPVYAHYDENGQLVPFTTKHQLGMQLPHIKKKYLKFSDYAGQTMEQVFGKEALGQSIVHKAESFSSKIYYNEQGTFKVEDLPHQVQYSTAHAILKEDINGDGKEELIIGGNFSAVQPEIGKYDASYGVILSKNEEGWAYLPNLESGLKVRGDVKYIASLRTVEEGKLILFARNNDELKFYKVDKKN